MPTVAQKTAVKSGQLGMISKELDTDAERLKKKKQMGQALPAAPVKPLQSMGSVSTPESQDAAAADALRRQTLAKNQGRIQNMKSRAAGGETITLRGDNQTQLDMLPGIVEGNKALKVKKGNGVVTVGY